MNNKYKLCVVEASYKKEVQPVNEKGEKYGDILLTFEDNDEDYWVVYENMGDENDEDWCEYGVYDNFEDALEKYKDLKDPILHDYELTLVLRAGCDTEKETETIMSYLKTLGVSIVRHENEGVKRLAYPVEGEARAEFRYITMNIPQPVVAIVGGYVEKRKNVLRYLLLNNDTRSK